MRIVDLFSGAGGLTFGFYYRLANQRFVKNERCDIVFANEYDLAAAEAFSLNYPNIRMLNCDIKILHEENIKPILGDEPIDLIIGGPPCQSYSTIGRRVYDDKAKLYNEYIRILSIVGPKMFLLENVKGMLSMKNEDGELIIDEITRRFASIREDLGYTITYRLLDAADYGVPQHRDRVFIVGIRNDLRLRWEFPIATHGSNLLDYLSVEDAISDFPALLPGQTADRYTQPPHNEYQRLMRDDNTHLMNHFVGVYGDKIQTVINHIGQGQGRYDFNQQVDDGLVDANYRLTSGYKNTYGRLIADQPCTTITKNMSTPSGLRCIHYAQNRALTPREGARIQTFPDSFKFVGIKSKITSQIGNAVPPLLAMQLAQTVYNVLEER